jgi:nucleoside-diphosphate-sugar epimerase
MTESFWRERRVLVTGAAGFIGSHIAETLINQGACVTAAVFAAKGQNTRLNLRDIENLVKIMPLDLSDADACLRACHDQEIVFSIAHVDGSASYKRDRPAFIFRQNMFITLNILEAARQSGVERFLVMSSAEIYSPEVPAPIRETDGFAGWPSRQSDAYAWSKRMSEFAAEVYSREHGMKVAIARPSNIYGPRDNFDPARGRVIPMFIRKALYGPGPIEIWGTGEQTRSFLYVTDLARGLLDLVERYPTSDPVNFSGERQISIANLARLISQLCGGRTAVVCDATKPAGPANRTLSGVKSQEVVGFFEKVGLEEGLQRTIDFYREQMAAR